MMAAASRLLLVMNLFVFVIAASAHETTALPEPSVTRIALGSCAFQWEDQAILNRVVEARPDIYLSLGDAIYGDFDGENLVPVTPESLKSEWARLAAIPAFQNLRANVPILATWDNHDYGCHDCGAEFSLKKESEQVFLDFWQVPTEAPVRQYPGVYQSKFLDSQGKQIQIILLDTRTFRDRQLLAERPQEQGGSLGKYAPNPNPGAQLLGNAQWSWLERELKLHADLRFIASSTQVIADQKGMDEWGNYPAERQRLIDLINQTTAGNVVLLSGNVHYSEVSKIDAVPYPLYDFTASGLTHVSEEYAEVPNPYRVSDPYAELNFGLVEISWSEAGESQIKFETIGLDGNTKLSVSVPGKLEE
jgi:alkaline phosphatase D